MQPRTQAELLIELEVLRGRLQELETRQRGLQALLACQDALGASLDLDQVEQTIVRQAASLSGAAGARLFLLEGASPFLRRRDGEGLSPGEVRALESLIGEGGPEELPAAASAAKDPTLPPGQAPLRLRLGGASYLGLPLALRDRLLGILAVPTPASRRYATEEIDLFAALARQGAVALQNARRFAALQRERSDRREEAAGSLSTLALRDALLREVHHRAKNNLQIVASLLDLQAGSLGDASACQALRESRNRLQSMARIHEHLYGSADVGRVAMDEYLRHLTTALREAYGAAHIDLAVEVGAGPLDVAQAIPCGLIVNELVSNAMRHAFPAGRGGAVSVTLETRGDHCLLTVRDTGRGFPPGADPESGGSLGLRLVALLAKQLGGRLHLTSEGGALARIAFPAGPPKQDAA